MGHKNIDIMPGIDFGYSFKKMMLLGTKLGKLFIMQ